MVWEQKEWEKKSFEVTNVSEIKHFIYLPTGVEHHGTKIDSKDGFDVIECTVCGFKHIIPIPTAEEMINIYNDKYYSIDKPMYLKRAKEDIEWWNLVYSERFDTFESLLPPEQRSILDVGSGPGFFLIHGKKRGWKTLGIEPSSQAAVYSRNLGLEIVEDFLTEKTVIGLEKFDVIHMSEVLEHIPDPKGMLKIVRRLLKPRGIICVVVPNDYNPFQKALIKGCDFEPWWVAPPHHINYFNSDSLSQLLSNSGFDVMLSEATFPIDIFLLMGDNYVNNDKVGRKCHHKRKMFEQNLNKAGYHNLKRDLYQSLANRGLGREVILFGRMSNNGNKI